MTISKDCDPNDEGVIDQFTSAIYEMEPFNFFANKYALEVVHHYFGSFSDEWYMDWIGTEEFRGEVWPDGRPMELFELKRFERMYDMYWDARAEWFNTMIANLNIKNLQESNRAMYLHTLTTPMMWEDYSKAAKEGLRVNHIEVNGEHK